MNKYIIIVIILVLLIGGGLAYKKFGVKESDRPQTTGKIREITITTKKKSDLITSKNKLTEQMNNAGQLQLEAILDVYYLAEKNK